MKNYLVIAAMLFTVGAAHADPCTMVDKPQATWAVKQIAASEKIVMWCESCGEAKPAPPVKPPAAKAVANKTGAWEVLVGGKGVDLATIYVQTGPRTFANVARLVGCPATGTAFADVPIPTR